MARWIETNGRCSKILQTFKSPLIYFIITVLTLPSNILLVLLIHVSHTRGNDTHECKTCRNYISLWMALHSKKKENSGSSLFTLKSWYFSCCYKFVLDINWFFPYLLIFSLTYLSINSTINLSDIHQNNYF